MESNQLGQQLKTVRETREMSQAAVAEILGIPRTAISHIESGKRSVSTLELSRLAELYRYPIASFFEEPGSNQDLMLTLQHMDPGMQENSSIHKQLEQCIRLCQEGTVLRGLLHHSQEAGLPLYPMSLPKSKGEAVIQGSEIAEAERVRLGLGRAPIGDFSALLGANGIWASLIPLPDHWSGLCLHHPSVGLVLLINAAHPFRRQRFSYAHEFAHALLDRDSSLVVSRTDNAMSRLETRANAFAAAFLMPQDGVDHFLRSLEKGHPKRQIYTVFNVAQDHGTDAEYRSLAGSQSITYEDVSLMAHHFGVSYRAALFRLKSLCYLSGPEAETLLPMEVQGRRYLSKLLVDGSEAPYRERNLQHEIVHLAIEAYRLMKISRGRLLELSQLLQINGPDLVEFAEATRVSQ